MQYPSLSQIYMGCVNCEKGKKEKEECKSSGTFCPFSPGKKGRK